MTKIQSISIGGKYSEYFDQLVVCATGNGRTVSSEVCRAIKYYIQSFEKEKLIANDDKWNDFIKNSKPRELLEMNTLICELNSKIMKQWNKKN